MLSSINPSQIFDYSAKLRKFLIAVTSIGLRHSIIAFIFEHQPNPLVGNYMAQKIPLLLVRTHPSLICDTIGVPLRFATQFTNT